MLQAYAIASYTIAALIFALGMSALLRNSSNTLNRLFALFSTSISVWLVSNYFASNSIIDYHTALIANRVVLITGSVALLTVLAFLMQLAGLPRYKNLFRVLTVFSAISWALATTPMLVTDIHMNGATWDIEFGISALLYFVVLLVNALAVLALLVWGHTKLGGRRKSQIDSILFSAMLVVPVILFTNAVLPFLFRYYQLTQAGSFMSIFIVFGMGTSIVRHRLFDIKFAVVRALAYVLSVATLVTVYSGAIFLLTQIFLADHLSLSTRILLAISVAISGLFYQPVKSFFDRNTNKVFYRDAYDPQKLLDQVNNIVLSTVDLDKLTKDAARAINYHLKASFVMFCLRHTAYAPQRVRGDGEQIDISAQTIEQISALSAHIPESIIIADYLEDTDELKRLLQKNNIAAVGRLVTTIEYEVEGQGVILFGYKKSGNPYSKQDENALGIITGEVVIAIENALRFEEIENFNVTLQEKVDDATKRLKRANDKLKAMDETKDEFISMASHQLRTPLTSVKGYVSMVLEGDAGPLNETQHKLLEQSFASSQRMVFLIADLLNLSRLRTGKFVIENKPTNLADVIESEIEQLKASAASRNLTLTYDKPKEFPLLMLDETKIRQVVMNFSDNAIYYTPSGGKIDIKLRETRDSVEFTVNDNGIGIPVAEQHHLFNKFYRAKNAQKARPDGTGLGLFMAKKVIIAQGGAIVFRSVEGKGSTFGFTFSKQKLKVPDIKPAPEAKEVATAKA